MLEQLTKPVGLNLKKTLKIGNSLRIGVFIKAMQLSTHHKYSIAKNQ